MCAQSQLTVVQDVRELAGAPVYDCRPPLLPVSIPLRDLRRSSADQPTAPSSLSAAPVEATPGFSDSVWEPVATPGFEEKPSDDPGTDVEDELDYVSPLPSMISPIPNSDAASPMSPAGYLQPPLPMLVGSHTTHPVEIALPTWDQFLPYTVSPEHVLYAPVVSQVTMDLPATPSFPSPGSLAAMDRILAGDVDLLMDSESDLPSLPSSLLPPRVLPPEPPMVPWAGGSPDLSRECPFDVSQDSSVSGTTPGL